MNFAVTDLLACIAALLVQQRYGFMLHCYKHNLLSLLFTLFYRYHILGGTPMQSRAIKTILFLVYIPSLAQFVSLKSVTFCSSFDTENNAKEVIEKLFGYDTTNGCVNGHRTVLEWRTFSLLLVIFAPALATYGATVLLRRKIASRLRIEQRISEHTRRIHKELLKVIGNT
ncbi:hypothetical protein OESDEN_12132 [Oesophagostomum dentatum]|uniref:G-protein coupled receptors family 1 profile domain-containing protein n=1 Tax=Oesophagostomum dentatum TaxID=61180 RepID=A0A0B1SRZ3_OESDE|nr:hypothetical protein OESDEN_12132 [Oesophagostomum dentatum]